MEEQFVPEFRVTDLDAALTWYQRLGFDLEVEQSRGPGLSQRVAGLKRGHIRLLLSTEREVGDQRGIVHLFVDDIASIADEFGVSVKKIPMGGEYAELRDPDGNRIEVLSLKAIPALGHSAAGSDDGDA